MVVRTPPRVGGARSRRRPLPARAGDLKSVVMHKMTLAAQKSTFPVALGVRITGVDDSCFAQTGESYSMITMPNADSHVERVLQEDNTELVSSTQTNARTHTPLLPC